MDLLNQLFHQKPIDPQTVEACRVELRELEAWADAKQLSWVQQLRALLQGQTEINSQSLLLPLRELAREDAVPRQWSVQELENSPLLEQWWEQERNAFLVPWDERETLLGAVDGAIEQLVAAHRLAPEQRRFAHQLAAERFAAAFSALQKASLRPENVLHELGRDCLECVQGVLRGSLPDAVLVDLMERLGNRPAWGRTRRHLQAYLDDGTEEALFLAAFEAAVTV